jgi:Ras-related protein Rab-7A
LKLVILGDSGVGKTSCLERFVNRRFSLQYKATIGADFLTKELELFDDSPCDEGVTAPKEKTGTSEPGGAGVATCEFSTEACGRRRQVCLQIWDTAGQERYQSLGAAFYRGADGCALMFDFSEASSLASVTSWREEFLLLAAPPAASTFPFVLLGNKVDLVRSQTSVYEATREHALSWCAAHHAIPFFETSALENTGIDRAMTTLARTALLYHEQVHKAAGYEPDAILDSLQNNRAAANNCAC